MKQIDKKIKCKVCKNPATRTGRKYKYCQACFDKTAKWEIVEYKGKLIEFDKLEPKEALRFLRDEALDQMLMLHTLKDFLVHVELFDEKDFELYCKENE